jgi:gliding motility-associated lipoprotein GldH
MTKKLPSSFFSGILFAFVLAFSACGDVVFEQEISIENGLWSYEDTLSYSFPAGDSARFYKMILEITHTVDFKYQNLYLQIHTRFPSGKSTKQVLSIELAEQSGAWLGKCRGKSCKLRIPLIEKMKFPEVGSYTLNIEQYMRESPVAGIERFNLMILKD